jgi:hypothetical protein
MGQPLLSQGGELILIGGAQTTAPAGGHFRKCNMGILYLAVKIRGAHIGCPSAELRASGGSHPPPAELGEVD